MKGFSAFLNKRRHKAGAPRNRPLRMSGDTRPGSTKPSPEKECRAIQGRAHETVLRNVGRQKAEYMKPSLRRMSVLKTCPAEPSHQQEGGSSALHPELLWGLEGSQGSSSFCNAAEADGKRQLVCCARGVKAVALPRDQLAGATGFSPLFWCHPDRVRPAPARSTIPPYSSRRRSAPTLQAGALGDSKGLASHSRGNPAELTYGRLSGRGKQICLALGTIKGRVTCPRS